MEHQDDALVVADICRLLLDGYQVQAREVASRSLPFVPKPKKKPQRKSVNTTTKQDKGGAKRLNLTERRKLEIWRRDGLRSRKSGARLVFPQTLDLLSLLLPSALPYDNPPHGKYELTHILMWELSPAIDHLISVRNSTDTAIANSLDTLIALSAPENSGKSWFALEHLGWSLLPSEPLPDWDGLVGWYVQYLDKDPFWFDHPTSGRRFKRWHRRLSRR